MGPHGETLQSQVYKGTMKIELSLLCLFLLCVNAQYDQYQKDTEDLLKVKLTSNMTQNSNTSSEYFQQELDFAIPRPGLWRPTTVAGLCLVAMAFSLVGILLWRRNNEYAFFDQEIKSRRAQYRPIDEYFSI